MRILSTAVNNQILLLGRAAVAAAGALACAAAVQVHAGPPLFTLEAVLSNGEWNNPSSVAVDSRGVVHVAYMTQHDTDSASKEIWYAHNTPGSRGSWAFTRITNNTVREEFPYLALDAAENVHIAFHTGTATSNMIRYVNNIGAPPGDPAQFNPIVEITGSGYKIVRHAVDSAGTVHLVYTSQTGNGSDDVFYNTWSAVGGVGAQVPLTTTPSGESAPDVAIGPGNPGVVHIVWSAGLISGALWYINNDGGTFHTVSTGVSFTNTQSPIVLVSPTNVVNIIFRVGDFLHAIDNSGGSFSAPELVYTGSYRPAFYNRFLLDDQGFRHIVFASNAGTNRGIHYVRETSAGFAVPQYIDGAMTGNQGVSIGMNAGKTVLTYSLSGFDSKTSTVFANLRAATSMEQTPCRADITGNGGVNIDDLLAVINAWGPCNMPPCPADVNNSGAINIDDLLAVINGWGACPVN